MSLARVQPKKLDRDANRGSGEYRCRWVDATLRSIEWKKCSLVDVISPVKGKPDAVESDCLRRRRKLFLNWCRTKELGAVRFAVQWFEKFMTFSLVVGRLEDEAGWRRYEFDGGFGPPTKVVVCLGSE